MKGWSNKGVLVLLVLMGLYTNGAEAGREAYGYEPKLMKLAELNDIPNFLKTEVLNLVKLIDVESFEDIEVRDAYIDMIKKGLIEDITKSPYVLSEKCLDYKKVEKAATARDGDIGGEICFSPQFMVKADGDDNLSNNISDAELVGLAFHEHAHHFGLIDEDHTLAKEFSEIYKASNLAGVRKSSYNYGEYGERNPVVLSQNQIVQQELEYFRPSDSQLKSFEKLRSFCKKKNGKGDKALFDTLCTDETHPMGLFELMTSSFSYKVYFKDSDGELRLLASDSNAKIDDCKVDRRGPFKKRKLKCSGYQKPDFTSREDRTIEVKKWLYSNYYLDKDLHQLFDGLGEFAFSTKEIVPMPLSPILPRLRDWKD